MCIFRQAYVFTSQKKLLIIIICYILWKKYGTMLITQYASRTGKEKVIANEEKGRRGPEKDAHLQTPSLMCWVSTRFQPKKQPNTITCFFVGPPPTPSWFGMV